QLWADGQPVTTRESFNLTDVAEARAHYHGFIVVLLVVIVDLTDRGHARIFFSGVFFFVGVSLVPVKDATHKWRNQEYPGIGTGSSLVKTEKKGKVTVDTFFFENFSGTNTFPRGSKFDQNAGLIDAAFFVKLDQVFGFFNARFSIKGQAGVNFGRNATGNNLQDFQTDSHCQVIGSSTDLLGTAARAFGGIQ